MIWPVQDHNGGTHFTLFAHTHREHASTSSQIVAKLQHLFHPFSALGEQPSSPAPMFCDNLRRGGA
jgi:hypothetical protein